MLLRKDKRPTLLFIIPGVIALLIIVVISGVFLFKEQEPPEVTTVFDDKEGVIIGLKSLTENFEQDNVKAQEKYKGKVIQVSGDIYQIFASGTEDNQFIDLKHPQAAYLYPKVRCQLQEKSQLTPLKLGTTVTIRGLLEQDADSFIILTACSVVEVDFQ